MITEVFYEIQPQYKIMQNSLKNTARVISKKSNHKNSRKLLFFPFSSGFQI